MAIAARTHLNLILVLGTLAFCLMLGGGTRPGFLSDAILQALCLPLLLHGLWSLTTTSPTSAAKQVLTICAGAVGLHLLQLIPLPPALWTRLGDRSLVTQTLDAAGLTYPWMPISLVPANTWTSLASLLPPIAILIGIALLTARERRLVSVTVLVLSAFAIFLGLLQFAQGPESALRFFDVTNPDDAVGFFANRNHFGAFLYCTAALCLAWIAHLARRANFVALHRGSDIQDMAKLLAALMLLIISMAAMAMTRSRAALGLSALGMIGAILVATREAKAGRHSIAGPKLMIAAALFAMAFASQFALVRFLDRFSGEPTTNTRLDFTVRTLELAQTYLPFGSGFGTFVQVFAPSERVETIWSDGYVNRAHNDWAEILLEAGVGGAALLGTALWWFLRQVRRLWQMPMEDTDDIDRSLTQAAALAITLIAIHSFVDYPLRTSAMAAMMAMFVGLLLEPAPERPSARIGLSQSTPRKQRDQTSRSKRPMSASTMPQPPSTASVTPPQPLTWPKEWQAKPPATKPPKETDGTQD